MSLVAPANDVLYALSVNIERDALPRELTEIEHELGKGLQVTEH